MPFVRYRLGDLVTRGPDRCPCGAPFSTIAEVQGRVMDMFPLPGGRQMHPYALVRSLVRVAGVRQYHILQEELDFIRVRLVGLDSMTENDQWAIAAQLEEECGPNVRVELEAVDEIRPEPNRKFRPYQSLVNFRSAVPSANTLPAHSAKLE
jgi:phenylacetate-CoA ligase